MKRRDFLTAAPAVALAAAVPGAAEAQGDTPIVRLYRRHMAIWDAAEAYTPYHKGKAGDEEMALLFVNEANELEDRMMAMPCTCAADFAAKMIAATARGGIQLDWDTDPLWIEARALIG